MCKYTIILSSPCPTEHRVPLDPRIPLIRHSLPAGRGVRQRAGAVFQHRLRRRGVDGLGGRVLLRTNRPLVIGRELETLYV